MEPNWKPLEQRLGIKRSAGFMFMGRVNGVNLYKHGVARMYLNLVFAEISATLPELFFTLVTGSLPLLPLTFLTNAKTGLRFPSA